MKNKYLLPSLISLMIVLFSVSNITAQGLQDYVITHRNDTIKCSLESQLFGSPKYKPMGADELIKINSDSIKEYCFHNKPNPKVSVKLGTDEDRKFLDRIEKGAICLYESSQTITTTNNQYGAAAGTSGTTTSTNTKIEWYAAKQGSDVVNIIKNNQFLNFGTSKKQRKKNFTDLLTDNPDLLKQFTDVDDYSFDAIRKTIQIYNESAVIKK
jgi:hypothetical protein